MKDTVRVRSMIPVWGVAAAVSLAGGLASCSSDRPPVAPVGLDMPLLIDTHVNPVARASFDFNGDWDGVTTDGSDTPVQFTIRNNLLVSASCQSDRDNTIVVLSTAVMNGEFSANAHDGFVLSGRIVSASQAMGQIAAPHCLSNNHPWRASKLGSLLKRAFLNNAD